MQKIPIRPLAIGLFVLCVGVSTCAIVGCSKKPAVLTESKKETLYTCPMHPTYLSHQPEIALFAV